MSKSNLVKLLTVLFFLIGGLDLFARIIYSESLRLISKPLIVPTLALVYIASVKKVNKIYLIALFFAFLGDVLLLNKVGVNFLLGLSSFLIVLGIYVFILTKHINSYKPKGVLIASLPYLITFISVMLIVKPHLGELFFPVLMYALMITVFGSLSFYNYLEKRNNTSLLMFLGAFLFMVSDTVIAIQQFKAEHKELELGLTIMFTYILAQYLICRYMISKSKTI